MSCTHANTHACRSRHEKRLSRWSLCCVDCILQCHVHDTCEIRALVHPCKPSMVPQAFACVCVRALWPLRSCALSGFQPWLPLCSFSFVGRPFVAVVLSPLSVSRTCPLPHRLTRTLKGSSLQQKKKSNNKGFAGCFMCVHNGDKAQKLVSLIRCTKQKTTLWKRKLLLLPCRWRHFRFSAWSYIFLQVQLTLPPPFWPIFFYDSKRGACLN